MMPFTDFTSDQTSNSNSIMATRGLLNIIMSGAGASYLTYRLTSNNDRTQSSRALNNEYSREVQDGMAFIGATKNYLAANGVELIDFMREFPHSRTYPVSLMSTRCLGLI
jgi:hypothetical protein